ncbi:fimbrial biogenesis usher protein [Enterobacter hormaechei]
MKRTKKSLTGRAAVTVMALLLSMICHADDALWFDPAFISDSPDMMASLSHFEHASEQLPGSYQVDIWLNGHYVGRRKVRFIARPASDETIHDNTGLMPCLSGSYLTALGVRASVLGAHAQEQAGRCVSLGERIMQASTTFEFQKLRLDISVPQADMVQTSRGWISPERWDEGINAGLLTYRFSGSSSQGRYGDSSSHYLGLNTGVNVGAWRLRDNRAWMDYDSGPYRYHRWEHQSTYAERTIIPWQSELTAGDTRTGGDVFDALGIRGVLLATDDNMLPDSMRGYAPVVRGTAGTNAVVTVRQNGYVVYKTNVSPGAFVINDLSPVYAGGDLEVTVEESNGRLRTYTVPYSSLPVMQRQGMVKYNLAAGRYRAASDYYSPFMSQGTLVWGLPHDLTLYGGLQYADHYRAASLGLGINMGEAGALSTDVTQADSRLADGTRHQGQSVRFLYARSLYTLGTTFQLTGYRYSTQGFHTLDETAMKSMQGWSTDINTVDAQGRPVRHALTDYYNLYNNKRERLQVNVSQRLGDVGSVYVTGTHQTYWNAGQSTDSLQAGFSSMFDHVSYSVSYILTQDASLMATDRELYLSLSVPLDAWSSHDDSMAKSHSVYATLNSSQDNRGNASWQGGLSGTALDDDSLDWSVSQGHACGEGNSGDVSLGLQGAYGNGNLGYSYSSAYRQVSYGLSGGAILHRNGLTLGQPLGDASVLVAVPGAAGVDLENHTGVRTDWRGYAVVPYASVYQENRVALDVTSLDGHTDVNDAVTLVVPTRGAVVRASFVTRTGARALMTLTHNGKPLPFGATVGVGDNESIVGDAGEVFLSGLASSGTLHVAWGSGPDQDCRVRYTLPPDAMKVSLVRLSAECH